MISYWKAVISMGRDFWEISDERLDAFLSGKLDLRYSQEVVAVLP